MKQYDPTFIQHLLDISSPERVAYLDTLPPEERRELNIALFRANSDLVAKELVSNLNRNVVADQKKREEAAKKAA